MKILVNDHSGHAFTYALCTELAERGHRVEYAYCSRVVTPKGHFENPAVVSHPISSSRTFEKYKLRKRVVDELRFGVHSARLARQVKPDRLVVANMPLLAVLVMWASSLFSRMKCVLWLQDIQAGLAEMVLGRRDVLTRGLGFLERVLIRWSWRVVAISDEFKSKVLEYGADPERVSVIENWSPIEDIPTVDKANRWSREHGLADRFTFIYSGTLALKHNPQLLLDLADAFHGDDRVQVVVVSEGVGADWLRSANEAQPRSNLQLLPFQPFERLAEVLGSADVLVAVLEREAGMYSVPSKVLAYLCAGRPILGSIPAENAAARMVAQRACAGICVAPNDSDALVAGARQLRADDRLRETLGANTRHFAEATFDRRRIAERFEAVLLGASEPEPHARMVVADQSSRGSHLAGLHVITDAGCRRPKGGLVVGPSAKQHDAASISVLGGLITAWTPAAPSGHRAVDAWVVNSAEQIGSCVSDINSAPSCPIGAPARTTHVRRQTTPSAFP